MSYNLCFTPVKFIHRVFSRKIINYENDSLKFLLMSESQLYFVIKKQQLLYIYVLKLFFDCYFCRNT